MNAITPAPITLDHLRAFQALVTTGTTARADAALNVEPRTVLHRIADLEAILGITLFTGRQRRKQSVSLTTYGRHVFAETVHILARVDYVCAYASVCRKGGAK